MDSSPLTRKRRRLAVRPTTSPGRWALGLAAASVVLLAAWRLLGPLGGFPGLALGLAGGLLCLVAVFRSGERGLAAYAALVPFLNAIGFVLGSILISD